MSKFMKRSYCMDELLYLNEKIHFIHRLGDVFAHHEPCGHRYRVKKGGRKEQRIVHLEKSLDEVTCSICFKKRTCVSIPDEFSRDEVLETLSHENVPLTIEFLNLKWMFYEWLYEHDY